MPKLSVLMTAKDAERTVAQAVRSTLRALPRDAELVVLDDGSRDATAAVVAAIADARVVLRREPVARGYAAGRHRLLDETDSTVVAIMDADDIVLPWRFAVQLRALADADLVVSPVFRFGSGVRGIRPPLPLPIGERAMALHLVAGCALSHPTLTARRTALEELGGYRQVVVEDYDLYLRASAAGMRLVRTAVPVLAYRIHAEQTSRSADFHARAQAEQGFQETYAAFVAAQFGVDAAARVPEFDAAVLREVIDAEAQRRRIGPVQRGILERYLRRQLPGWG